MSQQTKTFRLTGVLNSLVQTVLSNARLGYSYIEAIGFDESGRDASVRLHDDAHFQRMGQTPVPIQKWLQELAADEMPVPLKAVARIVGGGWSIQSKNMGNVEVARYGDFDQIPQHHALGVIQGNYVAIRLNHGLEITLTAGFPPVANAPRK